MSQCAEDLDIVQRFPTAGLRIPKFPEEPKGASGLQGRIRRAFLRSNKHKVVADLVKQLETNTFRLLVTAQSRAQFEELRAELFPQFVELSSTISSLIPLPAEDSAIVVDRVFVALGRQFADDGHILPKLERSKDEAEFCLQTLHRAHFLLQDVRVALDGGELPTDSMEPYCMGVHQEWWSMLHLRCLSFAIRHKVSPTDAVLLCVLEGFRHSVMAYAYARKAIDAKYSKEYGLIDFSGSCEHDEDCPSEATHGA
jgi:hypothetical protein